MKTKKDKSKFYGYRGYKKHRMMVKEIAKKEGVSDSAAVRLAIEEKHKRMFGI